MENDDNHEDERGGRQPADTAEIERLRGTEAGHGELEEVAQTEIVPNGIQRMARFHALVAAERRGIPDETTVAGRARERLEIARDIAAERRSGIRTNRHLEAFRLNEGEASTEDPAFANEREKDQFFFLLDVGRIRDCLARLKIQAIDEPYLFTQSSDWAPPSSIGVLSRNEGARRLTRSPPEIRIGVRFTTRRPIPSHTARGVRRLPVLVFCLPSGMRDPDAFVETLSRPAYHRINETDGRCHICQEPYRNDGSRIAAGPGNGWLEEDRPEIPVELPGCGTYFPSPSRPEFESQDMSWSKRLFPLPLFTSLMRFVTPLYYPKRIY